MAGLKLVGVKAKPVLRLASDLQIWRAQVRERWRRPQRTQMAATLVTEGVTDKGRGAERATGNFSSHKERGDAHVAPACAASQRGNMRNKTPRGRE